MGSRRENRLFVNLNYHESYGTISPLPVFELTIRRRLNHCSNDVELIAVINVEIASPHISPDL
jgi:hypothetical protein